jgi:hypothetical protein
LNSKLCKKKNQKNRESCKQNQSSYKTKQNLPNIPNSNDNLVIFKFYT